MPPIEYRQGPVSTAANGSLSFAEQRRLDEYKREREAMEAATSVKGNLPSGETERSVQQPNDPLQAIQTALINARAAQALEAACNLPAFRPEDWDHRSSEQNTNVRTIRSKKGILDSSTIRKSRNTSAEKERPPAAGMRSKPGG